VDLDDEDFDDLDFVEKSFNFSSTTAFTAAVIFSIVGGESFFCGGAAFTGDFALGDCERRTNKVDITTIHVVPLHRVVVGP
jgi:hypothetical protein